MVQLEADRSRVTAHFMNVERVLATHDVSQLSAVQLLVRQLLLTELSNYRAAERYPKQSTFDELTPAFIDAEGTRCAVAHLMELGGEHELVARIAREKNHARVPEFASEPRMRTWLEAAGLTVEEATTIQPAYGCVSPAECVCNGSYDNPGTPVKGVMTGVIEGDATDVRIDAVYGDTGTYRVGDLVSADFLENPGAAGSTVMIPLTTDGNGAQPVGLKLADGKYTCRSMGSKAVVPVSPENYFKAKSAPTATECESRLVKLDGEFAKHECPPAGCSVGDPTSLGILLSIAGVLLARRLR